MNKSRKNKIMKNFLTNYNWANWILLIFFMVLMCIDIGKEDYVSACGYGFVAIFNMFLILVVYQRRIMTEQDEQKEREEKIIEMLNNKKGE